MLEGDVFKHRSNRNPRCNPDFLQMLGGTVIDNRLRTFTPDRSKWTLKRAHDVSNTDIRCVAIESVPTVNAATTRHDAVMSKISKDGFEELHRNVLCSCERITLHKGAGVGFRNRRKFQQRPHCVINFGRNMHGHILSVGGAHV